MDLFHRFALLRKVAGRRATIVDDASDVARRSRWVVLGRVGDGARERGRAELQGYVRARAAVVIHREVGILLASRRNVSNLARQTLIDVATREVVDLVVADLAEIWYRSYRAAA